MFCIQKKTFNTVDKILTKDIACRHTTMPKTRGLVDLYRRGANR